MQHHHSLTFKTLLTSHLTFNLSISIKAIIGLFLPSTYDGLLWQFYCEGFLLLLYAHMGYIRCYDMYGPTTSLLWTLLLGSSGVVVVGAVMYGAYILGHVTKF